jgi:Tfp pilus assembly protein PilO
MHFPREKRAALFRLIVITAIVLISLWFTLGRSTLAAVRERQKITSDLKQKIASKRNVIRQAGQIKIDNQRKREKLNSIEDQMVIGDPYLWISKTLREFEIPNQLEFSRYDPAQSVASVFPRNNPYETLSFVVAGTATYSDLGNFLAQLENTYQYLRVRRLDVEPLVNTEEDKLSFFLELHVLVKPAI